MSTAPAKLMVMVGERFACIRISGRADFSSSLDFKTLVNELRAKGCPYFVLDVSDCVMMDSTFLGILAGFALKLTQPPGDQTGPAIELFNPNARITELLEDLGVLHLFKLAHGQLDAPAKAECHTPAPGTPSKEEVKRACLEAHRTLMDINPNNVPKFKEVAAFLAEDLKKLKKA